MKALILLTLLLPSCAVQYAKSPEGALLVNASAGGRTQAKSEFASFNTEHTESFKDFASLAKHAIWGNVVKNAVSSAASVAKTDSNNSLAKSQSKNSATTTQSAGSNGVAMNGNNNATDLAKLKDSNATKIASEQIQAGKEVDLKGLEVDLKGLEVDQ